MMNRQPDKLFKDKLLNYSKPVPPTTWNRLESHLNKKTHYSSYLKIAAALLVFTLMGTMLWKFNAKPSQVTDNHIASNTKPARSTIALTESEEKIDSLIKNITSKDTITVKTPIAYSRKTTRQAETGVAVVAKETEISNSHPKVEESTFDQEANNTTHDLPDTAKAIEHPVTSFAGEESVTLIYSYDETSQYLNKKTLSEATSTPKTSSTFKKVLQKAADLKNNQDPYGELRQKKNEILALNFNGAKLREQNK